MKITLLKTNPHTTVEVTEGNIYSLKFDHILLEDGEYLFNDEVFLLLGSSVETLPSTVMNWCTSLKLVSRAKPLGQAGSQKESLSEYNQEDIVHEETHHPSNKDEQLLKLAEELHNTHQEAWMGAKGVGRVHNWENASEANKQAWLKLAKKYSQPTSDLQQQLDDALKSECELRKELHELKECKEKLSFECIELSDALRESHEDNQITESQCQKSESWDMLVNLIEKLEGNCDFYNEAGTLSDTVQKYVTHLHSHACNASTIDKAKAWDEVFKHITLLNGEDQNWLNKSSSGLGAVKLFIDKLRNSTVSSSIDEHEKLTEEVNHLRSKLYEIRQIMTK